MGWREVWREGEVGCGIGTGDLHLGVGRADPVGVQPRAVGDLVPVEDVDALPARVGQIGRLIEMGDDHVRHPVACDVDVAMEELTEAL